jgi:hypothetical protein
MKSCGRRSRWTTPSAARHKASLVVTVVIPALAQAERAFAATLGAIKLDDLIKRAEKAKLA